MDPVMLHFGQQPRYGTVPLQPRAWHIPFKCNGLSPVASKARRLDRSGLHLVASKANLSGPQTARLKEEEDDHSIGAGAKALSHHKSGLRLVATKAHSRRANKAGAQEVDHSNSRGIPVEAIKSSRLGTGTLRLVAIKAHPTGAEKARTQCAPQKHSGSPHHVAAKANCFPNRSSRRSAIKAYSTEAGKAGSQEEGQEEPSFKVYKVAGDGSCLFRSLCQGDYYLRTGRSSCLIVCLYIMDLVLLIPFR